MINDVDVKDYSLKDLAKVTGYVPYSASDTFPMTVVDTVLLGRHPHSNWKSSEDDIRKVYDDSLDRLTDMAEDSLDMDLLDSLI